MTPDEDRRAIADILYAITGELERQRARIEECAKALKEPPRITPEYMEATTAAYHVFSAVKALVKLIEALKPPAMAQFQLQDGSTFEAPQDGVIERRL